MDGTLPANDRPEASGPLRGLRVVEFAGLGPAPFAGMLLADMGADVVRVGRRHAASGSTGIVPEGGPSDITVRGKRPVPLDLKDTADLAAALDLIRRADILIEGFRPGVMERIGLGPEEALAANPRLVYGRMTGWGQQGPLATAAGHDINYIAVTGALAAIGPRDGNPVPPLNLVGDYGGGALYLVMGLLAARLEASQSGRGQVVDCAMVDGAVSMLSLFHGFSADGRWNENRRGANLLDGGAPFYRTYECADGRHVAVGALEPQFFAVLRQMAGLAGEAFESQYDARGWARMHSEAEAIFRTRTRDEWCALLEGSDACVSPVLTLSEARGHPHVSARGSLVEIDGVVQSAPAPRFSRTRSAIRARPSGPLAAEDVVAGWDALASAKSGGSQ